jgi:hypothetical protein
MIWTQIRLFGRFWVRYGTYRDGAFFIEFYRLAF